MADVSGGRSTPTPDRVEMLLPEHRGREWTDREGKRWRFCAGGICNCWERQEATGWLRTERTLPLADFAPFTEVV